MHSSYSHASHSAVLLPTSDHSQFFQDEEQQHALLSLLYNKVAIEHKSDKGGYHQLFLQFDEDRCGALSCNEFRDTLANVGVPLSDEQSKWLLNKFDCNRDGKVDYLEFTKMITAWGQADDKGGARKSTGLNWKLGSQYGSPFKQADEAREARKKAVMAQYESILKAAHEEQGHEKGVPEILRKMAEIALEREGSLRKAFAHWDRDGDKKLGREDLGATLQRLDIDLTPAELTELMKTLDVDGNGEILYWEFVRVLSDYVNNEGKDKIVKTLSSKQTTAAGSKAEDDVLPTKSIMLPPEIVDEALDESEQEIKDDAKILTQAAEYLHEHGLHAHGLIKQLLPESGGKLDVQGLQKLFAKLDLPISTARALRYMQKGDVMKTGHLVSWELVRLLSNPQERE